MRHSGPSDCDKPQSASVGSELSRIVQEEADRAITLARQIPNEPVRSVHKCRKAVKRLRAIVRLGSASERNHWRTTDRKFRDAGRILAEARDSHVLPRTATALTGDPGKSSARQSARDTAVPERDVVDSVVALLEEARAELIQYVGRGDWSIEMLCHSLDETRQNTARRMERFRESGRRVDAHSWRKGVQRYANQVRLMDGFLPEQVSGQLDALDALDDLASCLGDFHDLTVFRDALKAGRVHYEGKARKRLLDKVRATQRGLRQTALDAGAVLFADASEDSASWVEARV